jgi:DNA replication protein DnaC
MIPERRDGHQQLALFNAHYDERCFQPIHVYDTATSRPVAMLLRPGKTPSGTEIRRHLRRLVRRIRSHWPQTRLTIRGDGHYGRPEVMAWCEANAVDYILGLPGNAVLDRLVEPAADDVRVRRAEAQAPALRRYTQTRYGAKSWRCERRVAARIEATTKGLDKLLLAHHLKTLKLPTFLREYDKLARQCASEGLDHVQFLARLVELELIDRERRMIERRIKAAKFPTVKSLDSFDFKVIPRLNKMQVLELARCEWIERRENVIALGPSGTGKTHVALGLGLAACQKGLSVGFTTAAALVHALMEARDERRLLRLQKNMADYKLLIIDELGFVPLSKTGAELLFELISQRYERGATLITSNLPFDEWTETFGSERLTGALLDRLTHHVSILEMNADSYRLGQSRARKAKVEA